MNTNKTKRIALIGASMLTGVLGAGTRFESFDGVFEVVRVDDVTPDSWWCRDLEIDPTDKDGIWRFQGSWIRTHPAPNS